MGSKSVGTDADGEAKSVGRDADAEAGTRGGGGVTVAARLRFSHLGSVPEPQAPGAHPGATSAEQLSQTAYELRTGLHAELPKCLAKVVLNGALGNEE